MDLRQRIEKRFKNCLDTKCEKEKCRLAIDNVTKLRCTIIDCDACSSADFPKKRCDYVLFHWGTEVRACVVELKGGNIGHVEDCVEQFHSGLALVLKITTASVLSYCQPVLLHGSGSNSIAIKALSNRKLNFRGARPSILVKRCGTGLDEILPQ